MTAAGAAADDAFEPSSDAESTRSYAAFEGSNVCRAAVLSGLLQQATVEVGELAAEQRALGFSEEIIERGGRAWREFDAFDGETELAISPDEDLDEVRLRRWLRLNESANPRWAVSFLIAMLGSVLERESSAAAAALWRGLGPQNRQWSSAGLPRWSVIDQLASDLDGVLSDRLWDPWFWWTEQWPSIVDAEAPREFVAWDAARWREVFLQTIARLGGDRYFDTTAVSVLARARLDAATRSPDRITRSLAFAAFGPVEGGEGLVPGGIAPPPAPPGAPVVSTMIHGTWGWKGDWWRPGGPFHRFILGNHRPNLFSRGAKFSWSGAYNDAQRALAACDFADWAGDVAPQGLHTVFGHSYGGEVAARAVNAGVGISELVLLSTPVTDHVKAASRTGVRVIDVRLRLDPVIVMARKGQRIPKSANVCEVLLRRWRLDHGASHEESVWRDEDVAGRGRL